MNILETISLDNTLPALNRQHYRLTICVYASMIQSKYRDQVIASLATWVPEADKNDVKCIFFLGEEKIDYDDSHFVYLPGVLNDYMSASYKQYFGMKYIYENFDTDFMFVCGSDTYPNIHKMLDLITTFDENIAMYIGGHGDTITLNGNQYYFHSGGAGFILTKKANEILYPYYKNLVQWWINWSDKYFISACDISMAVLVKVLKIQIVYHNGFYSCNHKSNSCCCFHPEKSYKTIITCHFMNPNDMHEFTNILNSTRI